MEQPDMTPGEELTDALRRIKSACEKLGVSIPSLICFKTQREVNFLEEVLTDDGIQTLGIRGGFEVENIKFKVRWE